MIPEYKYVSDEFKSNCMIEAFKAKIKDPFNVKLYFCKPRFKDGKFQCFHWMWSDGKYDYDFTDFDTYNPERLFQHVYFPGMIRQFPLGFAKEYSYKRNH